VALQHIDQDTFDDLRSGASPRVRREAFGWLHVELQPDVERFARRLVGMSGNVEDVVQKSFTSLWSNIDRIRSPESVLPYLFRIVRNLCFDELRRQRRFDHLSMNDDDAGWDDEAALSSDFEYDLPDETAHWSEMCRKVQQAINRLPERQRQAIILYAEEDLTYEQVAESMNVDIGTVKSRIFHARKNLRKMLSPEVLSELGMDKES
jgi:RNA polymerase sigma-70 factor, ECF subfamily